MKTQHTPGPWKVIRPGHGAPTKYKCVQIGADDMYTTSELLPADARLIASAPKLLELLAEIVRGLNSDEYVNCPFCHEQVTHDRSCVVARAERAIPKGCREHTGE